MGLRAERRHRHKRRANHRNREFESDGRLGAELSRGEAGALQAKRERHAAAISSPGLVPFSFSKRVLNE
jgi:hypothetical protein